MRPWKLASETLTLDHLSGGRVTLAVGLGATDTGFASFGEKIDRRERAELLDEGLEIVTALWRGQPFSHDGKHYHVDATGASLPAAADGAAAARPDLGRGGLAVREVDAAGRSATTG